MIAPSCNARGGTCPTGQVVAQVQVSDPKATPRVHSYLVGKRSLQGVQLLACSRRHRLLQAVVIETHEVVL